MDIAQIIIVGITFVAFGGLGWLGHASRESKLWSLVDVAYYPLAAVGIVLLFIHNEGQRELIDLEPERAFYMGVLGAMDKNKPSLDIREQYDYIVPTRNMLQPIEAFAEICPSETEKCRVAKKLQPYLKKYIDALSRGGDYTRAQRLLMICKAADEMLDRIAMPSGPLGEYGEYVKSIYGEVSSEGSGGYGVLMLNAKIDTFLIAAKEQAAGLVALEESKKYAPGMSQALKGEQVNYANSILLGLLPCVASSQSERLQANTWSEEWAETKYKLSKVDSRMGEIREGVSKHPVVYAWAIGYWPVFLLAGLSLKFGKAISGAHFSVVLSKISQMCFVVRRRLKSFFKS